MQVRDEVVSETPSSVEEEEIVGILHGQESLNNREELSSP